MIKFQCSNISWNNIKTYCVIRRRCFNYFLCLLDAFCCNSSIPQLLFYKDIFYPSNISSSITNTQKTCKIIFIDNYIQLIIFGCPFF